MRFAIARKLLAVCLLFTLPIVVMLVLMTRAQLDHIEFTSKELRGDAYQRPLEDVLEHASKHERLVMRRRTQGTALDAAIRAEEQAVAEALTRLDDVDRAHGEPLQFTPEGLGLRNRTEFTAAGLRRKWSEVLEAPPYDGHATVSQRYRSVTRHVRTMITHAGDTSNLILDPDLDSYYLMDVTLLALPQLEERLQKLATDVNDTLATGDLDAEAEVRLAVEAALLRQADWDRVVASANTAIVEDGNFQGVSSSLAPSLKPRLRAADAAMSRVLDGIQVLIQAPNAARFDQTAFEANLEQLSSEIFALHRAALDEEDVLLRTRVNAFERNLHIGWALAGAALLVSALLAFALSKNITRRVAGISAATKAFATGNMGARVGGAGSDELGELGESFDVMADRIGGLAAEVNQRADQLAALNANLEATVKNRTQELQGRNEAFRLILDNAHDGMLTVDANGTIASERSAAVDNWFGSVPAGANLWSYLGQGNPTLAAQLELGLDEVRADILPLEVTIAQLPQRVVRDGRHYALGYRPILDANKLSRILVVISDATSEVENQRAEAVQEETVRIFQACQRDRAGFLDFFVSAREIVQALASGPRRGEEVARAIHTLKGNCALFGVFTLSSLCHDIEDRMVEAGGVVTHPDMDRLQSAWDELSRTVTQLAGDPNASNLEVTDDEYAAIVDDIARGVPRREILTAISRWKLEPTARRLQRFADRAQELARRLGKDVLVRVESNGLRLDAETLGPVWAALTHVIRNSIDHGIETADERSLAGKSAMGHLTLATRTVAARVWVEVSDDGRGIDWTVVAAAAARKGLPHATRNDLVEALFADGVSTADAVTELSGRGVGMSAIRETCRALGGDVQVDTELGRGTTIRCTFPENVVNERRMAPASRFPIAASVAPPA